MQLPSLHRGYPQPNVTLQRDADERAYGVRRAKAMPSAQRRSRRAPAPQTQNPPAYTTKRGRTSSSVADAPSSDLSTTSRAKRAFRVPKDTVEPVAAVSLPADDILAQLRASFTSTFQKIKDGITEDELSAAPPTPPPPVELPPPVVPPPVEGQPQGEDMNFPELIGKYQAMERVGEGAFGAVYKSQRLAAHPKGLAPEGQFFAVKRIVPVILPLRILTEIRFLRTHGGIHHVVRLEEVLKCNQQISIVFPLFAHHPWPEYYWKLNVKQMLSYMHQLLEALAHIHNFHLIHRDVKPTNCLYNVDTNELMLIDFGFAEFEPVRLSSSFSAS